MSEAVRWALIDLLRVLDRSHGGRLHAELGRIAQGLGIEIPRVDPVPNPRAGPSKTTMTRATRSPAYSSCSMRYGRQPSIRTASAPTRSPSG